MNKYITSSIFIAAGLGSVSASALNNLSDMRGSDTLLDFTRDALTDCGATGGCTGLTYNGTGSGNGEGALYSANEAQTIAPMSKFLTNKICGTGTSVGASDSNGTLQSYGIGVEQQAYGMVVGLDAVTIWGNPATAGNSNNPEDGQACGGPAYDRTVSWALGTSPTYGKVPFSAPGSTRTTYVAAVHTYGPGTYTNANWADVLRIIYTGIDNTGCQDCESDIRNGLIQNWGNLFENGAANCGGAQCTQLNHAYRRDDQSGTTETFLLLISAPSVTKNAGLGASVGTDDAFCNSAQTRTGDKYLVNPNYGNAGNALYPIDPPALWTYNNTNLGTAFSEPAPDFKDRDPIRRPCAGTNNDTGTALNPTGQTPTAPTEQVCSPNGQLGVVLPIVAMDYLDQTKMKNFPTNLCQLGKTIFGPQMPLNNDGLLRTGTCPNGDSPIPSVGCLVPADATGNPNCQPQQQAVPAYVNNAVLMDFPAQTGMPAGVTIPVPPGGLFRLDGTAAGSVDGRLYGLQAYYKVASSGNAGYLADNTLPATGSVGRYIVGLYSRIHSTRSMLAGAASLTQTCQFPGATDQLGCLPLADPCSLSFAGLSANTFSNAIVGLPINTVNAGTTTVQNLSYKLARKLYLNSMIGFGNVWGEELNLAKWEAQNASIEVTKIGFVPLQSGTYCEDFNEQMMCSNNNGTGNNNDACTGNPLGLANETTCGNGKVEMNEECDVGPGSTQNYSACPATDPAGSGNSVFAVCNQQCRVTFCFTKPTGCSACPCITEHT